MAGSPTPTRRTAPTALDDAALESEYAAALESYIGRMETFACVPPCFTSDGIRETHADLEGHGIAPGEWFEYLQMRVEHIVEAKTIGELSAERTRRHARDACEGITGMTERELNDELLAELGRAPGMQSHALPGESVRDAVLRMEGERMAMETHIAKLLAILDGLHMYQPQRGGRVGRAR